MIWHSSLYSKWTVFTVNTCYLQALAMYKNALIQAKSIMGNSVFFMGGFPLTYKTNWF